MTINSISDVIIIITITIPVAPPRGRKHCRRRLHHVAPTVPTVVRTVTVL